MSIIIFLFIIFRAIVRYVTRVASLLGPVTAEMSMDLVSWRMNRIIKRAFMQHAGLKLDLVTRIKYLVW
jgi:hypothetical protein